MAAGGGQDQGGRGGGEVHRQGEREGAAKGVEAGAGRYVGHQRCLSEDCLH